MSTPQKVLLYIEVNPGGGAVTVPAVPTMADWQKILRSFGCQLGPSVIGIGTYGPDGSDKMDMSKKEILAGMVYGASSVRMPGVIVNAPPPVVAL